MIKNISFLFLVFAAIQCIEAGNCGSQNEAATKASTDSDVENDCSPGDPEQPKDESTAPGEPIDEVSGEDGKQPKNDPNEYDNAGNPIATGEPVDGVSAAGGGGESVDEATDPGDPVDGVPGDDGTDASYTNDGTDDGTDDDTDSSSSSLSASITALLVALSMVFFY